MAGLSRLFKGFVHGHWRVSSDGARQWVSPHYTGHSVQHPRMGLRQSVLPAPAPSRAPGVRTYDLAAGVTTDAAGPNLVLPPEAAGWLRQLIIACAHLAASLKEERP